MPRMTLDELLALPVTVDIPTAGRAFGLGANGAYRAVRAGEFPVRVHQLGRALRITRADLLAALGVQDTTTADARIRDLIGAAEARGDGLVSTADLRGALDRGRRRLRVA